MTVATPGGTGHRALPHTADVIVEAWAPSRTACLAETVRALVDTFADVSTAEATERAPVDVAPGDDADIVVGLLEEVLYMLDVHDAVPVMVSVTESADGGLRGSFELAPLSQVDVTGPAPKGIAGTTLTDEGGGWVCRATIDV